MENNSTRETFVCILCGVEEDILDLGFHCESEETKFCTQCEADAINEKINGSIALSDAAPDILSVCKRLLNDPEMDGATAVKLLAEVIEKAKA